ncbi:MAG: hypothetical protein R3C53_17030 [Pirellulaceae bacterium]
MDSVLQTRRLLDDFSVSEFGRFRFTPTLLESHYHFELAVPIDFRAREVGSTALKRFKEILHLEAVDHPGKYVSIALANLDHDINPADWLAIELAEQQAHVTQRSESLGPEGVICDCLVAFADGTQGQIRTVKDGKRLFLVGAMAAKNAWEDFKQHAAVSLASFILLHPQVAACAEPLTTAYVDPGNQISFQYPASWKEKRYEESSETVICLTHSHSGVIVGELTAHYAAASSLTTPHKLAQFHSLRLRSRGFKVAGAPLLTLPEIEFEEGYLYEPSVSLDSTRFVCPCIIFRVQNSLVLFGLVGPTQGDSPEWWAINKRALEIAYRSIRIGSERS